MEKWGQSRRQYWTQKKYFNAFFLSRYPFEGIYGDVWGKRKRRWLIDRSAKSNREAVFWSVGDDWHSDDWSLEFHRSSRKPGDKSMRCHCKPSNCCLLSEWNQNTGRLYLSSRLLDETKGRAKRRRRRRRVMARLKERNATVASAAAGKKDIWEQFIAPLWMRRTEEGGGGRRGSYSHSEYGGRMSSIQKRCNQVDTHTLARRPADEQMV